MSVGNAYLSLVIGLICGWSTAAKWGGAYGVLADLAFGTLGAIVAGVSFRALGVNTVFAGMAGTICGSFIGAASFLVALRFVRKIENR
jgi:uncharacterized membrane protein YeaQ/YmgE (transglycosylase-associated protein family)